MDMTIDCSNIFDSIDWGQAWIDAQEERRKPDNPEFWDGRAPYFAHSANISAYAKTFLEYAAILPGETVFDMGCGAGTLTLPLAREGHEVTATDFSPKMLEYLQEACTLEGLDNVRTVHASWEDDWEAAGIEVADVAFASRSIAVRDLKAALVKLNAMARRRVCLTLSSSTAPRYDALLFAALRRQVHRDQDYIYCYNILYQMGVIPECRLISTMKNECYDSYDEACASIGRALGEVSDEERPLLDAFCKEHLLAITDADGTQKWKRDYELPVNWMFISWDKLAR